MTGLITVEGITHFYRRQKQEPLLVLDDIDAVFEPGSFTCLIGASGCGKSTLLKIMAGLIEPSIGTISLDGQSVRGPARDRGMVFQQDAVFPWLSVLDNISYGPKSRGVPKAEYTEKARYWADKVGLAGFEDAMPKELSGGMRKRVDIARVYANEPQVLLMDEPFGALDAQTKERMQNDLVHLWEGDRRTVVFVTHDLDEALVLSDQIVVMSARPGRIHRIQKVEISRPRSADTKLTDEFMEAKRDLYALLRGEDIK